MSEQVACSVQATRRVTGDGRAFLARDTRNGDHVWMHEDASGSFHPYPFRLFRNVTDFHDYIVYKRRNPFK